MRILTRNVLNITIKVGRLSSKEADFISFDESSLNMMKNAFYFILKAVFVFNIFIVFS